MFEIAERTKRTVKIYGKEYSVSMPTVKQSREYTKALKGLDGEQGFDKMLEFMESLGLPKAAVEEIENALLESLVEYLIGSKKN